MTLEETKRFFNYAMLNYPGCRLSDDFLNNVIKLWAYEFKTVSFERMIEAFKYARSESPQWMPTLPQIQNAITAIDSQRRVKTEDQEFRDTHGGKSKQEWEDYQVWSKSEDGIKKIDAYRARLKEIIGDKK